MGEAAVLPLARGLGRSEDVIWDLRPSGELFELQYGKALTESDRRPGRVVVYGSNGPTGEHDEALFKGPGVILGRKGMGHLGVKWAPSDYWVIDTAYSLAAHVDVDLKFAYYLIGYVGLDHLKHGTSNPSLTRQAFAAQLFPVPPMEEQRSIAEVLGALDDKIAANDRVIARVDEVARLLYRKAVVDGEQRPLSSLASFVNGRAYTKNATGTGRVVVRIAELNSGLGGSTVYNDIEVPEENLARPGDLLFAWSGSLTAARWYRPEAIINQHIFKVIPAGGMPMWLVNQAVHAKLDEFKAIAADKATTMGHIQRRHLDEPVAVPTSDDIARLDSLMGSLWESALAAEVENQKLAATRDELLPLLMSGKVRVTDEGAPALA